MLVDGYKWWIQAEHSQITNSTLVEDEEIYKISRHLLKANLTYLDGHGNAVSVAVSVAFSLSKLDSADTFGNPGK